MSTLVADRRFVEQPAELPSGRRGTAAPVRAPRRRDQVRGPNARPLRVVPAPSIRSGSTGRAQACSILPISSAPTGSAHSWRLTERGVAVVLVVALMLAVAALTVIGLTAVRVTSPSYQVSGVTPVSAVEHPAP